MADHHNRNLLQAVEQENFGYFYPIVKVLNAVYKYKIISLLVIILSLAYFLGLIWIIITKDLLDWKHSVEGSQEIDNFYEYYHEDDTDDLSTLIKTTYFALTTLSTIGFGDFSPRTTSERMIWSVVLLSGVTCLSIIINNLMDMVRGFQTVYREDSHKDLFKWITLLSRFNNGNPINKDLITEIEGFFDYYWNNDRMRALNSVEGDKFVHELPSNVTETIILEFLFRDFLFLFKSNFNYRKQKKIYYLNFRDKNCREKMREFLICLEPRIYLEGGPLI